MAPRYGLPAGINAKEDKRRKGLNWVLAKLPSPRRLSSPGTGCLGQWWSHHSWRDLTDLWMFLLGTWFSGGLGSAGGMVWLDDLRGLF